MVVLLRVILVFVGWLYWIKFEILVVFNNNFVIDDSWFIFFLKGDSFVVSV